MQVCARCGRAVTEGGKWDGPLRFCGDECLRAGPAGVFGITRVELEEAVWKVHQGACPRCHGHGPVDVHSSHHVRSIVLVTWWRNDSFLACEPCARAARWKAARRSMLLGWWGFPIGLVMTPVQVWRNVAPNLRLTDSGKPSEALVEFVHARLTSERIAARVPEYDAPDEFKPGRNVVASVFVF